MKASELAVLLVKRIVEHGDFDVYLSSRLDTMPVTGLEPHQLTNVLRFYNPETTKYDLYKDLGPWCCLEPNLGP
jgi:hypothetical protein